MTPVKSPALRVALYARVSTERQSEESIPDQFHACERFAEREGFEVVARFSDLAISGGTSRRPGYQALLEAARRHEFDVVLAEDMKRLWREQAELWRAIKELIDLKIALVTVSGVDSRQPNFELIASVMGASGELDRKESAYRTRRGLDGRARSGKPTGGKAYGYTSVRVGPPLKTGGRDQTEIQIVPEQAEVVRRIFTRFADGQSPRAIAAELNADGIPSPGASWSRTGAENGGKRRCGTWQASAIHGEPAKGTGILNNRKYVGEFVWGRTTWTRGAADSSKRRVSLNAAPAVARVDESLRIVPQALWDRVKARQASVHESSRVLRRALAGRRGRPITHLLSGLISCGTCGAHYIAVNSREYGCSTHKGGGRHACANGTRLNRKGVEESVRDHVRHELLSDEAIELAAKVIHQELLRARKSAPKVTPASLAAKDRELAQLRALLKAGTLSPTVAQAGIAKVEEERDALLAATAAKGDRDVAKVVRLLPEVAKAYRAAIDALPNTTLPDIERMQGRALLQDMLGGQAIVEQREGRVMLRLGEQARPFLRVAGLPVSKMVAGACFATCVWTFSRRPTRANSGAGPSQKP